jgi:hypothetical protein
MNTKYISSKETAALIRVQLKKNFPTIKFYVRSDHNSIDIDWIDGPSTKAVERITNSFSGGGFDGMIDLEYSISSWLLPDGSAIHAHSEGTEDSRGSVPGTHNAAPEGAVEVHFCAKYIFTHRHYTPAYAKPIIQAVCKEDNVSEPTFYERKIWIGGKQRDEIGLDWDSRDLDHWTSDKIWKRLNGEVEQVEEVEATPEPVQIEEPKAEEPKDAHVSKISVTYDRDWTWIEIPAQDDENLRNILKNELKARWSFRRLAWFIMNVIDEQTILTALNIQPAQPVAVEIPSRFNLLDD